MTPIPASHKAQLRTHAPLVLPGLAGCAAIGCALHAPCGSDECLGPLFAGASACVWILAAPGVVVAEASRLRRVRVLAWVLPFACLPAAWAFALALFVLHPGPGGA